MVVGAATAKGKKGGEKKKGVGGNGLHFIFCSLRLYPPWGEGGKEEGKREPHAGYYIPPIGFLPSFPLKKGGTVCFRCRPVDGGGEGGERKGKKKEGPKGSPACGILSDEAAANSVGKGEKGEGKKGRGEIAESESSSSCICRYSLPERGGKRGEKGGIHNCQVMFWRSPSFFDRMGSFQSSRGGKEKREGKNIFP